MKIMRSKRARIISTVTAVNILLISACAIYAHLTADAIASGLELVPCYVKHTLGFYCPGCGGSRALVELFRLDPITSFVYNPIPVICAALLLWLDILSVRAAIGGTVAPLGKFSPSLLILVPVITLLHFLVRLVLLFCFGIDPLGDILG